MFTTTDSAGMILDVLPWWGWEGAGVSWENPKKLDGSPEGASVALSSCVGGGLRPGKIAQGILVREDRMSGSAELPGSLSPVSSSPLQESKDLQLRDTW